MERSLPRRLLHHLGLRLVDQLCRFNFNYWQYVLDFVLGSFKKKIAKQLLREWLFSISSELRHREYDSSGTLASKSSILKESGFHEKQFVIRRGDKVIAQIVEFQNDHVKLHVEEGPITGYAQVSVASFLEKKGNGNLCPKPLFPQKRSKVGQSSRLLII